MTGETPNPRPANVGPAELLDSYRNSLFLQDMRIAVLQSALEERVLRVEGLEQSVSWRLTGPLRLARSLAAGRLPSGRTLRAAVLRTREILASEGGRGLRKRVVPRLRSLLRPDAVTASRPDAADAQRQLWTVPAPVPAGMRRSVLIVAELSLPQCAKYRVWQKQEHFARLGWHCAVVDWNDTEAAFSALQCATEVIFYRAPGRPPVLAMIAEARRLGLRPFWEVDDLIFDDTLFRQNTNIATLPPALREGVLSGIPLYRAAMLACGRAIASTPVLARCMREAGVAEAVCIENALDDETLSVAAALRRERQNQRDRQEGAQGIGPMIVYGSGTKTHDADFAVAAPALVQLMQAHPALRLRIIGELNLPEALLGFGARIEALPGTNYRAYLRLLAAGDIAIAPLEDRLFNDAKSNIKFQEAAILGLPCVSSPRAAFTEVMVHGHNGLLADTDAEWEAALGLLILDAQQRQQLGHRALADVLARYGPAHVATSQVLPVFGTPGAPVPQPERTLRVLMVNVYLWPRSFGGATMVAEELAARLHARDNCEVALFTSRGDTGDRADAMLRYDWQGIPVFATRLPADDDHVAGFDNPTAVRAFASVLDAMQPDVVHAHCVQGFGAGILRLCQERGIPYVITLHDAWWLCDRQFMVRGDGNYCFQSRIDLRVCQACVPHARHLDSRQAILSQVLGAAAHLLCPSETHRQLHLANGVAPGSISVSRNGTRRPLRPHARRRPGSVPRFGFVGGNVAIKGFPLLRRAFEAISSSNWELVLVDNTVNLGFSSIDVSDWTVSGQITVVPAYSQDELDTFFDRIDVLLFPSQWKESFGLAVREALARDVWVITTAPGGQADDIEDGINGRLIALDGASAGLLSAIEEIIQNQAMLDSYINPHHERLADYDGQAEEVRAVLQQAAHTRNQK